MSNFESTFKAAIAQNERKILIESLRAAPELSLGELHRLSKGELGRLFAQITVGDLMGSVGEGRPVAVAASKDAARAGGAVGAKRGRPKKVVAAVTETAPAASNAVSKAPRGGKAREVDTRTADSRAGYDAALFQAVRDSGGPVGASSIIARAGGTSLQARVGLSRLIEAGRITWSGKARGTKYSVV